MLTLIVIQSAMAAGPPADLSAELRTGWDHVGLPIGERASGTDGLLYGVSIAARRPVGQRLEVGAYVAADFSTAEGTGSITSVPDPVTGAIDQTSIGAEARRDLSVGLRFGVRLTESWTGYLIGGFSSMKIAVTQRTRTITPPPSFGAPPIIDDQPTIEATGYADGWRVGLGTAVDLTEDLFARADYLYTAYDEEDTGVEIDRHQVVTAVGLRF